MSELEATVDCHPDMWGCKHKDTQDENTFNTDCVFVDRILFPGGGTSIISSSYEKSAKLFYDLAIQVKM